MLNIVLIIFLVLVNISVTYSLINEEKVKANKFKDTLKKVFENGQEEDTEDDNELNKALSLKETSDQFKDVIEVFEWLLKIENEKPERAYFLQFGFDWLSGYT